MTGDQRSYRRKWRASGSTATYRLRGLRKVLATAAELLSSLNGLEWDGGNVRNQGAHLIARTG